MPIQSKRYCFIKELKKVNYELFHWSLHRYLTRIHDPLQDDMDQDYFMLLEECKSRRYLFRSKKYRKNPKQWQEFFDDKFYNESEFREHFRLSRSSFIMLYHLIKSHPAFSSQKKRWPQSHVKLQLLIFLYKISCSGTGGKFSIIGKYFKVSKGNARSCFHQVLIAVLALWTQVICWPTSEEKKKTS